MIADAIRTRFEALTNSGEGDVAALAARTKAGDMGAAIDLAALMARAGFVEPALILDTYDAATAGWYGQPFKPTDLTRASGKASPALWGPFWDFLDDETKMDAGS